MPKSAIAIDRRGLVLDVSPGAVALFDDDLGIRNRRVFARDKESQRSLEELLQKLLAAKDDEAFTVDPILVRRKGKVPVVVRFLFLPVVNRNPSLGARAILTFTVLEPSPGPSANVLSKAFNLSPAEARLAVIIAKGVSLQQAAKELGIARETARNQLKAAFAKTGTHRQGELIALLAKL